MRDDAPASASRARVVVLALDAIAREREIASGAFCEAMEAVVEIIGCMGAALSPAKSDVRGNVDRVRRSMRDVGDGLFDVVRRAQAGREGGGATSAAKGVLWLKRFGEFACALCREVGSTKESMRTCAGTAYERTLRQYHGYLTRGVFSAVLTFPPSRESFVANVGSPTEMLELADKFEPILRAVDEFLTAEGLNDPTPV